MGTDTDRNGLAGPTINAKKTTPVASMVNNAHPASLSSSRSRNRWAISAVYPASTSAHNRIEPSSADHIVATLNNAGVRDDPLSATYCIEKSRVISPRCIATVARIAPARAMNA